MADFLLTVGIVPEVSLDQMQKDISKIVTDLQSAAPKVKIGLELDTSAVSELQKQIANIQDLVNKGSSSKGNQHNNTTSPKAASASTKNPPAPKLLTAEMTQYVVALKQIDTLLGQVSRNQERWTAAKTGRSKDSYKELENYRDNLQALKAQLESGSISQDEFKKKFTEIGRGITNASNAIKLAGENTLSWSDRIKGLVDKFSTWFSITRVVMAAYKAVKQMVTNVIELDTAMTELKKVTNETDIAYERFLVRATSRARELGATLTDTVNATADFARLGFGIEDAEKLADSAIIYKNVGDGIENISDASESLIATMQAFGINAEDAMSIVDKFNEVGNNYAISSKGVGEALLRSAAAMHSANNTLDETIALATAANTVVQDPEKVGTTLRTVSMYLRAAKTDAEDAGESTEGMASSISELRYELWKLTGKKVDIQLDDNTFKSTYDILKELSEVWDELSDVSQANILELVGGKRNSNVVSALLENFSVAQNALKTSQDSDGSAMAENEKVLESIQGKLNVMKATFQTLSQNLINSGLIKFFVDFLTGIMNFINGITTLLDKLWLLKNTLTVLISAFVAYKTAMMGAFVIQKLPLMLDGLVTAFKSMVSIITTAIDAWKDYAEAQAVATASKKAAAKAATAHSAAMQATIPVIGLLIAAITVVASIVGLCNQRIEENRQKMIEEGKQAGVLAKDLDGLIEKYRELGADGKLDGSDRDKAYDIHQQINELLGEEVDKINLANGEYKEQLELLKDIQYHKADDNKGDIKRAYKSATEDLLSQGGHVGSSLLSGTKEEDDMIVDVLTKHGFDGYMHDLPTFYIDTSSEEAAIKSYEDMINLRDIIEDSYETEIEVGGKLRSFYDDLNNHISKMGDSVSKYKNALEDYNTSQAVIKFNENKFGGIIGAGIDRENRENGEKAMTKWLNAMIKSKKVTDGQQAQLIALARTWYPEYNEQIEETITAKAQESINTALVDKSLSGNIDSLTREASALDISEAKMIDLVRATIRFSAQNLNVTQKVAALKEIAVWAGVAEKKMDAIFNSKDTAGWAARNGVTVNEHADIDGTHTYTYNGQTYRNKQGVQEVLIDEAIQKEIEKMGTVEIPGDGVPKNPNTSGGKTNEALDNYLKDAENRYKIHQNESQYIDDLNYALSNLVKTKEEELDVTGKINEAYRDLADNRIKDLEHQIALKKELYGENYDATAELTEIQRVAKEEADRLRAMGYDNNSDEIQALQNTWWDAENNKLDIYSKQHENLIRDIEHARDMALENNPFADTTSYYKQMQDAYHAEAERLRSIDPEKYKEDIQALQKSWHDAQNAIADWSYTNSSNWIALRNTYNDWDKYGDNEAAAWKRVLDRFRTEFPTELDKIRTIESNYYNAVKKEITEILDLNQSRIESTKTLLSSYHDVTNAIAEAQHEINRELQASQTMYEYLDESTRKLLFNQEDYNKLSDELIDIQAEADKLQRRYTEELRTATADTLDEITSKYEMQYELLMKSYEVSKAELEVAKKRQQLDNVLNERNVRMFVNGQWQWVANTQDVINAQNELADAEYEAKQALLHKEQTESINKLTSASDGIATVINKIESGAIDLNDEVGEITSSLSQISSEGVPALRTVLNQTTTALGDFVSGLGGSGTKTNNGLKLTSVGTRGSSAPKSNATATIPGLGTVGVHIDSNGKTTTSGLPAGTIVHTSGGDYQITGGSGGSYTSEPLKQKLASGTKYTLSGSALMGEDGREIYIDENGRYIPIEHPTVFANIAAGGKVFNGLQLRNLEMLWDLSNNSIARLTGGSGQSQTVSSVDNSIHINGMTISEQGNEDWISGLKRYVYTHKGSM